jgi:hypothetical protein
LKYTSNILTGAVRSGDLSKVVWLHRACDTEQRCELGDHAELCYAAAKSGSIALLDWQQQSGVAPINDLEVCEAAARHVMFMYCSTCMLGGGR